MKNVTKSLALILSAAMMLTMSQADLSGAKTKVKLNRTKVTLNVGKKVTLKVKGTKKKIKWSSSKKKIAKVTKKGVVTGLKAGTAKITAKTGKKNLVCKVTVKKKDKVKQTATPSKLPVAITPTPTAPATSATPTTPVSTPSASPVPSATPEAPTTPVFSAQSGTYTKAFTLTFRIKDGYQIYYTTDGSIPDETDFKYTTGIEVENRDEEANVLCSAENIAKMYIKNSGYDFVPEVDDVPKCTVIRAISVSPTGEKSPIVTRSFFVGRDLKQKYNNVAVVSLVTDPDNLLNYDTGIMTLGKVFDEWKKTDEGKKIINSNSYWDYVSNYTQKGREWEREASLELFDGSNSETLTAPVGIRIHGGASRMYGQRSFNIYMRKDYGQKTLNYGLFEDAKNLSGDTISSYKSFMLRNGGNDTEITKFHDVLIQSLVSDRNYMTQSARPAVLYLNGEYWGIYNLTEKYSDKDIAQHFDVDSDNIVAIKESEVEEGVETDIALYEDLLSYAEKDMSNSDLYEEFCGKVDIQSMLDYYATEIYVGNADWPDNNFELWRTREPEEGKTYGDCKWRWMLYDTEYSMGLYGDSRTNVSYDNFTAAVEKDLLFAALVKNASFRESFLSTIKDIGSTNFDYDKAYDQLQKLKEIYKPFMYEYYDRFMSWNPIQQYFEGDVNKMDDYLERRYNKIIPMVTKDLAAYDN